MFFRKNWHLLPSNMVAGPFGFMADGTLLCENKRLSSALRKYTCDLGHAFVTKSGDRLTIEIGATERFCFRFKHGTWLSERPPSEVRERCGALQGIDDRAQPAREPDSSDEDLQNALRYLREVEFPTLEERSRAKEFLYRTRRFLVLGSRDATLYVLSRDCPALRKAGLLFTEKTPNEVERWVVEACASALKDCVGAAADPEESPRFSETEAASWQKLPSNARFGAFRFFSDGSFAFDRVRFSPGYPLSGCPMGDALVTWGSGTLTMRSSALGTVDLRFEGNTWFSSRDLSSLAHLAPDCDGVMREPSPEEPTVTNVRTLFRGTAETPTVDAAAVGKGIRELHFDSWEARRSARSALLRHDLPAMARPDPKSLLVLKEDEGVLRGCGIVFSSRVPDNLGLAEIEVFSGPYGPALLESLPDDVFELLWRQGPTEIAVEDRSKRLSLYPRSARDAISRILFQWVQALLYTAQSQIFSSGNREDWVGLLLVLIDEIFLDEAQLAKCPAFGFENEAEIMDDSLCGSSPHRKAIAWLLEAHDAIVFQASDDILLAEISLDVPPDNSWLNELRESTRATLREAPKLSFTTPDESFLPQDDLEALIHGLTAEDLVKWVIGLESSACGYSLSEITVETQIVDFANKGANTKRWNYGHGETHFRVRVCTGYVACNLVIVRLLLAFRNGMRKPLQFVPMRLIPSEGLLRPAFSWELLKEASALSRGYLSRHDGELAWRIAKDLFAIQFFHEIAHAASNHEGLRGALEGKGSETKRNVMWAMEAEADWLAVLALSHLGASEIQEEGPEGFKRRFETIAWALNLAYRFSPLEKDPYDLGSKDHTPWGHRFCRTRDIEAPEAIRWLVESEAAPKGVDCLAAWKEVSPRVYDHVAGLGEIFMEAGGDLEEIPDTSNWRPVDECFEECERRIFEGSKHLRELREVLKDGR